MLFKHKKEFSSVNPVYSLHGITPFHIAHYYPSYFKLQVCWLLSLTPVTYLCKLLGIHSIAAFLQFELFWV
ncbi:hypothetical protein OS11_48360 [Dickeya oryzae]